MLQAVHGHSPNFAPAKAGEFDNDTGPVAVRSTGNNGEMSRRSLSAVLFAPLVAALPFAAHASDPGSLSDLVQRLRAANVAQHAALAELTAADNAYARQVAIAQRRRGLVLVKGGRPVPWAEAQVNAEKAEAEFQAMRQRLAAELGLVEKRAAALQTMNVYEDLLAELLA